MTDSLIVITGSDCSGSDGAVNRTYTVPNSNIDGDTLLIVVNRSTLIKNTDYTFDESSSLITFLVNVFNGQKIQLLYSYTSGTTSSTSLVNDTRYTSRLAFARFLRIETKVPNRADNSTFPDPETVGTGDGTTTQFVLDNASVIYNSLTLSYGASVSSLTALNEDDDFELDYDTGVINLTASGLVKVGTDNLYAKYSYYKINDILDSEVHQALLRAEAYLHEEVNTIFFDGTEETPDVGVISNESVTGQGRYDRVYQTEMYPIANITTTTTGTVSASSTAVSVSSTTGFPSSGVFAMGTNKVSYTGKDSTTFTGVTGVDTAVITATKVDSLVVERSIDGEGTEPTWEVLTRDDEYSVIWESGNIKDTREDYTGNYSSYNIYSSAPRTVWDRMRFSYLYGYNEIYEDIKNVVHLIAAKNMFQGQVLNALSRGTDGFSTESIQDINREIIDIINNYKCIMIRRANE